MARAEQCRPATSQTYGISLPFSPLSFFLPVCLRRTLADKINIRRRSAAVRSSWRLEEEEEEKEEKDDSLSFICSLLLFFSELWDVLHGVECVHGAVGGDTDYFQSVG